MLLALVSAVILGSESHRVHHNILLTRIQDSPPPPSNLVAQDPVFRSPRSRVVQLYPQALGSLFLADSTEL
jgi:hypothetical protein